MYKVFRENKEEVNRGDKIKDFRDEEYIFRSCNHPRKIIVGKEDKEDYTREFFAHVFNLEIIEQ